VSDTVVKIALALQRRPAVRPKELNRLLQKLAYLNPENSFDAAFDAITAADEGVRMLSKDGWDFAERVVEESKKLELCILSSTDPRYPRFLMALREPPPLIHMRGNIGVLDDLPGVAIVGARKASENGLEIARRIGAELGAKGFPVISGLALGIDAAAHAGALQANAPTIAVLASGVDKPSPKQNERLAYEILDHGGALVSEHPLGTPPKRHHFVPRNRIQTGLSAGAIIVEAEEKSGSTTQAQFCLELSRPLFAVVPDDEANTLGLVCAGTSRMVLDKGAIPIKSKADYPNAVKILEDSRRKILSRWMF